MKIHIIQIVGIFWLLFGCFGFYFSTPICRHVALRIYGAHASGTVLSERTIRDSQATGKSSSTRRIVTTSHRLSYRFETADGKQMTGYTDSSLLFYSTVQSTVDVVYLPWKPSSNSLFSAIEITPGYLLFFVIASLFFTGFFAVPGVGLIYLGRERN